MPIYEYICRKCGEEFALFQRVGAEKDTVCPSCGSKEVRKNLSSFSCSSSSGAGFSPRPSSFGGGGGG